ncbi:MULTISPECIES: hypothetical protein [Cupriavidus]
MPIFLKAALPVLFSIIATFAFAQEGWNPESIREQQCAIPPRTPNDAKAMNERRLYKGILPSTAICILGAPDNEDRDAGTMKYADGRVLIFRNFRLESIINIKPNAHDEPVLRDPQRDNLCAQAKVRNPESSSVRIGDSPNRVRCIHGSPSDIRYLETASVYIETWYYNGLNGLLDQAITIRNGRVSAIQNF